MGVEIDNHRQIITEHRVPLQPAMLEGAMYSKKAFCEE